MNSDHFEPDSAEQSSAEMPRYKCHKEVWALKISEIREPVVKENADSLGEGKMLFFAERGYAPQFAPKSMFSRYNPGPGDYYVVYSDGYKSFSPQKAFEEGYTALS